jgi:hypothetical protein
VLGPKRSLATSAHSSVFSRTLLSKSSIRILAQLRSLTVSDPMIVFAIDKYATVADILSCDQSGDFQAIHGRTSPRASSPPHDAPEPRDHVLLRRLISRISSSGFSRKSDLVQMLSYPAPFPHFFSQVTDHRLLSIEKWNRVMHFLSDVKAIDTNSTQLRYGCLSITASIFASIVRAAPGGRGRAQAPPQRCALDNRASLWRS